MLSVKRVKRLVVKNAEIITLAKYEFVTDVTQVCSVMDCDVL